MTPTEALAAQLRAAVTPPPRKRGPATARQREGIDRCMTGPKATPWVDGLRVVR